MSEINREIPKGQAPKATIINFEAAKAKRIEEKTRHARWIQERTQNQPLTRIDATTPAPSPVTTETYQSAQSGRRVEFTGEEGDARENRPPNENTYMVIDIQKARVNRLLKEQSNLGVFPESNTFTALFLKPRLIDAEENVVNDSDDNARNQEKNKRNP
jgi:hypothetical protein